MDKKISDAFRVYAHKAPVNRRTSQIKAHQAYRLVEPLLTPEEKSQLGTALSHALFVGEGRGEFDEICNRISLRIFGVPLSGGGKRPSGSSAL